MLTGLEFFQMINMVLEENIQLPQTFYYTMIELSAGWKKEKR